MDAKIFHVDFLNSKSKFKLLENPNLWASKVLKQLSEEKIDLSNSVLIGYSMGGRLALLLLKESIRNSNLQGFKKVIALSSNPGIPQESLSERTTWIAKWVSEFNDFEKGLQNWNSQSIFEQSKGRSFVAYGATLETVKLALETYDYLKLPLEPKDLQGFKERIVFLFGEKDEKYQRIKRQLILELGANLCFDVPNAGHRLPFDEPSNTAKAIIQSLSAN